MLSYEKMFQASAGLLATVDANGHFRALNPTWERILGWSLDELRSKPFIEFVHPSDREVTLVEVANLLQGNTVDRFDNRYLCKDGSYRWLGWAARVDTGDEPSEQIIYATAIDVTSDRERQSQLEPTLQDAKVYEKLFRVSVGLLVTLDSNGYFRHANPAWGRLLGWSPEEMTARPFIEFVHPDDRPATAAEAAALFEGKMTIRFDNRYQCKDGTYKWLAWTAYMDPSEDESTRLVYGTAHDVTSYKELLGEFERTLARLRDTMEAMSTPFIPITERIVVMPLVGQMDTDRIHQVMTVALEGVQSTHVQVVILDVTGLRDLDTRVARALLDTAKALQLLGAKTILTGIRPSLAQTLVGLGLDLGSVITKGTLQSAIASALTNDLISGKPNPA
ncbi:rsbT co-antagonist protein RsbR [Nannocystis exedens]|uniref:RsbT co-antagonist protein RsbR n=1 Tax=Nannocystis exedens TaxID=54 RepID=A0A1I2ENF1_9BACT|nr:PAS domain S-box protein [Nannocystis exedens]PCC73952.1 RsbT co-antagonist protein RsbRA [Nannocystis exedens]SFE93760.1 rsbT co-antagonist protein RsbR [Nannocystis exedens]